MRVMAPDIMCYVGENGQLVEDIYYKGPDLFVVSDVLRYGGLAASGHNLELLHRYILTWIPAMPYAHGVMSLVNVEEDNNRCVNEINVGELESACQRIVSDPQACFSPQYPVTNGLRKWVKNFTQTFRKTIFTFTIAICT